MEAKFKLCLSTIMFWTHFIEKTCEYTAKAGYKYVDLAANRPFIRAEEVTEKDIIRIQKALEDYGLQCVAVTTNNGAFDWCLSSPYDVVRQSSIEHVKKSVDLAYALGAKVVESESGPGRIVEDDPVEEWKRTKEAYTELAEYASQYDIIIGQEASRNPLVRQSHVIENIKQSIQLVKEINHKNLRVLMDTAHTAQDPIMGIPEAIDLASPWLVHVHCSDSPLTYHEHMPIGDGKINWEAVITALKRVEFDKFVTLELGFVSDPIGDAEKARCIFDQYMQ